MRPARASTTAASALLGATAGLHVLWGLGSSWPLPDRASFADAVIGTPEAPPPAACFAVAGLLTVAAAAVSGQPRRWPALRRLAAAGTVTVLSVRGGVGLLGRTDLLSPGSSSQRFLALDRRAYSPLCLSLAALSLPAALASPAAVERPRRW